MHQVDAGRFRQPEDERFMPPHGQGHGEGAGIDDLESAGEARIVDHHARPENRAGHARGEGLPCDLLGGRLRGFVGIAKFLPDKTIVLANQPGAVPEHVGGADVEERMQVARALAGLREMPGAPDIDLLNQLRGLLIVGGQRRDRGEVPQAAVGPHQRVSLRAAEPANIGIDQLDAVGVLIQPGLEILRRERGRGAAHQQRGADFRLTGKQPAQERKAQRAGPAREGDSFGLIEVGP